MTKRNRIICATTGFGAQDSDSQGVTADLTSDLIAETPPSTAG